MNLGQFLTSDKQPLIVSVALTIFGWYVTNAVNYFQNQDIIYVSSTVTKNAAEYEIRNISLTRALESLVIRIACVKTTACLVEKIEDGEGRYGRMVQVSPFAAAGNKSCVQSEQSYGAVISMAPGAAIKLVVNKTDRATTEVFLEGKSTVKSAIDDVCSGEIRATNVRVETWPSLLALFLENFMLYYFVSLVILIVVFVCTLYRIVRPAQGGQNHEAHAYSVDVTLRRSDQSRSEPS